MSTSKRTIKRWITVPIYDAEVVLVVSDDIPAERTKMDALFGPSPDAETYEALTCHSGGNTFGLFFDRLTLTLATTAHEVFHLTHRILEWTASNFDAEHHEQGAMLYGYLLAQVCSQPIRGAPAFAEIKRAFEKPRRD